MSKDKTKEKKSINWTKVKIKAAKVLTYLGLFTAATYGLRKMFEAMPEGIGYVLTVVIMLGAVFVLSLDEK